MGAELIELVVVAVVLLAGVALLGFLALMAFIGYLCLRYLRVREWESEPIGARRANDAKSDAEEGEGPSERAVLETIHRARNADRMYVEEWKDEKRADGWSEEDIEAHLANREPIELN